MQNYIKHKSDYLDLSIIQKYIGDTLVYENGLLIDRIIKGTSIISHSVVNVELKETCTWYSLEICNDIIKQSTNTDTKPLNILLLGVSLGAIIIHLSSKLPNLKITGVDIDDKYYNLIKHLTNNNKNLNLLKIDANEYIKEYIKENNKFDIIIIDIFNYDEMPKFIFSKEFITNIDKNLNDGGKIYFNALRPDISTDFFKYIFEKNYTITLKRKNYNSLFIITKKCT